MTSMMNPMVGFKHAWAFYTNNIGTLHDFTWFNASANIGHCLRITILREAIALIKNLYGLIHPMVLNHMVFKTMVLLILGD